MKVYVGAKFEDKERVRAIYSWLEKHGHTVTHKWTQEEQPLTVDVALSDLKGVTEADAAIFLIERDYRYKGAYVELGAALGTGVPVYVFCLSSMKGAHRHGGGYQFVFLHHPLVQDLSDFPALPHELRPLLLGLLEL